MKPTVKRILLFALIGGVTVGAWLAYTPKPVVKIAFLRYTMPADGEIRAQCEVRNLTAENLVIWTFSPQSLSNDRWQWLPRTGPIVQSKMFIGAGMAVTADLPLPNGTTTWRAAGIVRTHRQELLETKIRRLLPRSLPPHSK
jgi:hypothetical protein